MIWSSLKRILGLQTVKKNIEAEFRQKLYWGREHASSPLQHSSFLCKTTEWIQNPQNSRALWHAALETSYLKPLNGPSNGMGMCLFNRSVLKFIQFYVEPLTRDYNEGPLTANRLIAEERSGGARENALNGGVCINIVLPMPLPVSWRHTRDFSYQVARIRIDE